MSQIDMIHVSQSGPKNTEGQVSVDLVKAGAHGGESNLIGRRIEENPRSKFQLGPILRATVVMAVRRGARSGKRRGSLSAIEERPPKAEVNVPVDGCWPDDGRMTD